MRYKALVKQGHNTSIPLVGTWNFWNNQRAGNKSIRRRSSIWEPAIVLHCVVYFISHQERSLWQCWKGFHKHKLYECYVTTYDHGNMWFQQRWHHAITNYDIPALSNKHEAVDACHGNVTTPQLALRRWPNVGPTSTLTLGQRRLTNVGPTWICQLAQRWPNGCTPTLAQRCANIGPTLAH